MAMAEGRYAEGGIVMVSIAGVIAGLVVKGINDVPVSDATGISIGFSDVFPVANNPSVSVANRISVTFEVSDVFEVTVTFKVPTQVLWLPSMDKNPGERRVLVKKKGRKKRLEVSKEKKVRETGGTSINT